MRVCFFEASHCVCYLQINVLIDWLVFLFVHEFLYGISVCSVLYFCLCMYFCKVFLFALFAFLFMLSIEKHMCLSNGTLYCIVNCYICVCIVFRLNFVIFVIFEFQHLRNINLDDDGMLKSEVEMCLMSGLGETYISSLLQFQSQMSEPSILFHVFCFMHWPYVYMWSTMTKERLSAIANLC